MMFIAKSPSAARPARAARVFGYPAIARIWRSYTAKVRRCHPSEGVFGGFWRAFRAAQRSGRCALVRASASAWRQAEAEALTRAQRPDLWAARNARQKPPKTPSDG